MQVRNIAKTLVVGVATLASASVFADEFEGFDFDGLYILAGVNYAGVNDADFETNDKNFGGAFFNNNDDMEAKGNIGWRGGLGAWLTDNFAVEFNYFGIGNMHSDSGREGVDFTIPAPSPIHVAAGGKQELHTKGMYSFDLSGLGRCFFTDQLWGFARLGVAWASVTREVEASGFLDVSEGEREFFREGSAKIAEQSEGGMGAAIGIGAQYDFTEMFGLRAEASTIQALNNNDSYAVGLNLVVNFGELM